MLSCPVGLGPSSLHLVTPSTVTLTLCEAAGRCIRRNVAGVALVNHNVRQYYHKYAYDHIWALDCNVANVALVNRQGEGYGQG